MSTVDVLTSIPINAPLKVVADYACNPDNAPAWYENIKSVEWKTPKPLRIGSEVAFQAKFLGRTLKYTYKIVEYTDRKWTMKTAEGPFPMETTYTFQPQHADTTVMTLRNNGTPSGFSKLFVPIMRFMMRKANQKDLKKIKFILERSVDGKGK
jgi:hypothetical protein